MKTTCPFCLTEQEADGAQVDLRTSDPMRCVSCRMNFTPTALHELPEAALGAKSRSFTRVPEIRIGGEGAADDTIQVGDDHHPDIAALAGAATADGGDVQRNDSTGSAGQVADGTASTATSGTGRIPAGRAADRAADRYKLVDEIARGGMGAVFRARDRVLHREVAVKVIRSTEDERRSARFVMEAQITGQLEHPNIVPVHDLGLNRQGRPFFAMKLVRGQTLSALIAWHKHDPVAAEAEFPLTRLLRILIDVSNAIGFAHSRGVIHRDLKPANIMVGDFGETMVMDWGLAKMVGGGAVGEGTLRGRSGSSSHGGSSSASSGAIRSERAETSATGTGLTQDHAVVGTPVYMSPEQAAGRVGEMDARSDIYALGAILYEILTLHPPIQGQDLNEVLLNVTTGRIIHPAQRNRGRKVPPDLAAIALTAMANDPAKRYGSAITLRRDLEAYLSGRTVSVASGHPGGRALRFVRRHLVATVAVGLGVAALAVSLALVGGAVDQPLGQRPLVPSPAAAARRPVGEDRGSSPPALAVAAALVARGAFAEARKGLDQIPEGERNWVWRRLDLLCSRPAEADGGAAAQRDPAPIQLAPALTAAAVARDAGRAVVCPGSGTATVWDLAARRPLQSVILGRPIRALAISADGRMVAVAGDGGLARVMGDQGGQVRAVVQDPPAALLTVAFSPDGRWFATGAEDGQVVVWATDGGSEVCRPAAHAGAVAAVAFSPDGRSLASAGAEGQIRLVALPDGRSLRSMNAGSPVHALAWSPGAAGLVSGGDLGPTCWDAASGALRFQMRSRQVVAGGLAFDAGGSLVLVATADSAVTAWDARAGRDLLRQRGLDASPVALGLASGSGDLVTILGNGTAVIHPATPSIP